MMIMLSCLKDTTLHHPQKQNLIRKIGLVGVCIYIYIYDIQYVAFTNLDNSFQDILIFFFNRKQSLMWMQGDLYRARTKDDKRRERHHSVSKILTAVDDMRIQDAIELEKCGYQEDENSEYVRTECYRYFILIYFTYIRMLNKQSNSFYL